MEKLDFAQQVACPEPYFEGSLHLGSARAFEGANPSADAGQGSFVNTGSMRLDTCGEGLAPKCVRE